MRPVVPEDLGQSRLTVARDATVASLIKHVRNHAEAAFA